jgi:hypothetical protein
MKIKFTTMADAHITDFKANIPTHLKYPEIISYTFSTTDKIAIETEEKRLRTIGCADNVQVYYIREFIGALTRNRVNEKRAPGSPPIMDYDWD